MALPLRLIWNLQMPRAEKIGIGALFCSGFVCIVIAVLRVVQIGVKSRNSTPSSTWLALWAEVEAAIAVVIGCCPAFAAFWRTKRSESKGYGKAKEVRSAESGRSGGGGGGAQGAVEEVEMQAGVAVACTGGRGGGGGGGRGRGRSAADDGKYWADGNSSQEELAKAGAQGIYVTRSIRVSFVWWLKGMNHSNQFHSRIRRIVVRGGRFAERYPHLARARSSCLFLFRCDGVLGA